MRKYSRIYGISIEKQTITNNTRKCYLLIGQPDFQIMFKMFNIYLNEKMN